MESRAVKSEGDIVRALADHVVQRVVNNVREEFENLPAELSGDDSGLADAWEEFCVQVRFQYSTSWHAYLMTLDSSVRYHVEELEEYERLAIWYQTEEGIEWWCANKEDRKHLFFCSINEVCRFVKDAVFSHAADWSSPSVEKYLGRFIG